MGERRQLEHRRAQFAFFLLTTIAVYCISENALMLLQYVDKEQTPSCYNTTKSQQQTAAHHIVVAHCTENLEWLNQLHSYNPLICTNYHVQIYSKCGIQVNLKNILPDIVECTTLHRIRNFGTEEYAYMRYIEDRYDSLPSKISFVQGGGLSENPHIIYDIMISTIPEVTYMSLSRHVRGAWHMTDYKHDNKTGEKELLYNFTNYLVDKDMWDADWRGMFSVSGKKIRQHSWNLYYTINDRLSHDKCVMRNCQMETFFSSMFGCNQYVFDKSSHQNCTEGVYKNISYAVFDEDYEADATHGNAVISTEWMWNICNNKALLRSPGTLNGGLICLESNDAIAEEKNRELLSRIIAGDVWKANYTNLKWKLGSQWKLHEEISDEQLLENDEEEGPCRWCRKI